MSSICVKIEGVVGHLIGTHPAKGYGEKRTRYRDLEILNIAMIVAIKN